MPEEYKYITSEDHRYLTIGENPVEPAQLIFTREQVRLNTPLSPTRFSCYVGVGMVDDDWADKKAQLDEMLAYSGIDLVPADDPRVVVVSGELNEGFFDIAQYSVTLFRAVYPIYAELFPDSIGDDGYYGSYPMGTDYFVSGYSSRTLESFMTTVFGVYRKDLVRACFQEHVTAADVAYASLFARHVPIDWVIDLLNDKTSEYDAYAIGSSVNTGKFDALCSHLSPTDIRRIMKSPHSQMIPDVVDMAWNVNWDDVVLPKRPTLDEIHDALQRLDHGLSDNVQFTIPDDIRYMEDCVINGVKPYFLTSSDMYAKAGMYMNNCAGTTEFAIRAKDGDGVLLMWDTKNVNTAVLCELQRRKDGWVAVQAETKKNTPIPQEDFNLIRQYLKDHALTALVPA